MSKPPIEPRTLSPLEAARRAGVSRSRIYELLKSGEILAVKDGSRTLVITASVDAWLDRLKPWRASTGPLLPIEQQQIAIERASPPIDQQQPAAPDICAIYAECLRLLAPNGEEEGQLRAFERAVRAISRDCNCSIDEAKQLVLDAIAKAKEPV
jgi:excisionase family DNA binding protein